jgi:hypothetical protein
MIPLSRGLATMVDDEDYEHLNQFKWYAQSGKRGTFYAARHAPSGPKKHDLIFMHRAILGLSPEQFGDHINGDGLDNQRHNLRPATRSQNARNAKKRIDGLTSPYKGVSWTTRERRWRAVIQSPPKKYCDLGFYRSEEEAARAYDVAADIIFGEFARLNFPRCL